VLAELGADKDAKTATSWIDAPARGVKVLVQLGVEKAKDARGGTPLHIAAGMGNVEAVTVLAQLGADIAARMDGGDTSLQASGWVTIRWRRCSENSRAPHAHSRRPPGSVHSRRLGRTSRRRERRRTAWRQISLRRRSASRPPKRRYGSLYPRPTLGSTACNWVVSDAVVSVE
jgi:hypothetical protein